MLKRLFTILPLMLALPNGPALGADFTKPDMDALVKQLQADSQNWLQDNPADPGTEYKIRSIVANDSYVSLLGEAISQTGKDPANLYVANRLIAPLLMAKDEVVQKALPIVQNFYAGAGGYQDFPNLSDAEIKALQAPNAPSTGSAPAGRPTVLTAREAKIARERPIMLHNQQLYKLELSLAKLMLFANTPQADKDFLNMLKNLESKGVWSYTAFVDALRAETEDVRRMKPQRAKLFYDNILELSNQMRLQKKTYIKPADIVLSPMGQTTVPTATDYTGQRLVQALNVIAPRAKMPAMKVPTPKEIEAANKKNAAANSPKTGGKDH